MESSALSLRQVTKKFGETVAVSGLDLHLTPGELLALVGPSGSGKSTVLQLIAGLLEPDAGQIVLGDRSLSGLAPGQRDVAMVFQDGALYPHLTVAENLAFPLRARGKWGQKAVVHMAERLDLQSLLERRPAELSGGERQRVALGRALIRKPRLFLLDEPLSSLDLPRRDRLRVLIRDLVAETGVTTLYVTHDQAEAMAVGDRIAVMEQGRIVQSGSPEDLYRRPNNLFIAGFFGSPAINTLAGVIDGTLLQGAWGQLLTGAAYAKRAVVAAFRPEDLVVSPAGPVSGVLQRIDYFGHERIATFGLGEETVRLRLTSSEQLPPTSTPIGLAIAPERLLLFDAVSGERLV